MANAYRHAITEVALIVLLIDEAPGRDCTDLQRTVKGEVIRLDV